MVTIGPIFNYFSPTSEVDIVDVVKRAASTGATALEMHTRLIAQWSPEQLREFRALTDDLGLTVVQAGGVMTSPASTYSPDYFERKAAERHVIGLIEIAGSIGSTVFNGSFLERKFLNGQAPPDYGFKREEYFERLVPHVRAMAQAAQDAGMTLCQEIACRYEFFLVNTAAEAVQLAEMVDHPNFLYTYDSFHAHIEEDDDIEAVRTLGPLIGHVQLGEANRRLPGKGKQIDWPALLSAVRETGFDKSIILEGFVIPHGPVARYVSLWRDLSEGADLPKLEADLRESMEFVLRNLEGAP